MISIRDIAYSWGERRKAEANFPEVRRIARGIYNFTSRNCPGCGLDIYEHSRLLRVIEERARGDYVVYLCAMPERTLPVERR